MNKCPEFQGSVEGVIEEQENTREPHSTRIHELNSPDIPRGPQMAGEEIERNALQHRREQSIPSQIPYDEQCNRNRGADPKINYL